MLFLQTQSTYVSLTLDKSNHKEQYYTKNQFIVTHLHPTFNHTENVNIQLDTTVETCRKIH